VAEHPAPPGGGEVVTGGDVVTGGGDVGLVGEVVVPLENCAKNRHVSPGSQDVEEPESRGSKMWPPSNACQATGYPARHPE
jgi:hypothetical protein